jgi:hypothetical protein
LRKHTDEESVPGARTGVGLPAITMLATRSIVYGCDVSATVVG